MQRLGLDADEFAAYVDAISGSHKRRVRLETSDLDGNQRSELEPMILSGQITMDSRETPTRKLRMTFLDPSRSLVFEPESVSSSPVHRSRMLIVHDERFVPALGRWVDCVVFTGPMFDYDRAGAVVTIEAHGKEIQALGARWDTIHRRRKFRKDLLIRRLAVDTGETKLRIPNIPRERLVRGMTVLRLHKSWPKMSKLARSMNRQLFYDGAGFLVLRRIPTQPVFTFTADMLLSEVRIDRNPDGIHNVFLVVGGDPRGPRRRVSSGPVHLPARHENSAKSLARNGQPLYLVRKEKNDQLRSDKACKRRARDLRDAALRTTISLSVDVLPVPFLDETDPVRVVTPEAVYTYRATSWTLPLTGEAMSLGARKRAGGPPPKRSDTRRGRRSAA